jgi:hypothetical protein
MDEDKTSVFIGVIIFTLVFLFIVVVIIALSISEKQNITPNTNYETGVFLSPCGNNSSVCNTGLECDGSSFTCKLGEGLPCTDFTDCIAGLICSGVCATGATGNLNDLCPCTSQYRCKAQLSGPSTCKGVSGTICSSDSDCYSDLCTENNTCASGKPNSFPCLNDDECSSKNCSKLDISTGYCQPLGVKTGTLGAACSQGDNKICINPPGKLGAECISSDPDNALICQCSTDPNTPGVCVTAIQGILSSCNINSACTSDLYCADERALVCNSGSTGCSCIFQYQNPNQLKNVTKCINGMTLINDTCKNNSGLGCDSNNLCASNVCSGPSVMTVYNFSDVNTTAFLGAINTTIKIAFPGPTFESTIFPYKMFGFSVGNIDTIYLVDYIQGLLSIDFNTSTNQPVSPGWTQHIHYITITTDGITTNKKTLIDAAYNQQTFLIAFNEEITKNSDGSLVASNNTLYAANGSTITPFNPQPGPGIPGTQYDSANKPLNIAYIDISKENLISSGCDVLISTPAPNFVYIKQPSDNKYTVAKIIGGTTNGQDMKGTTGPVRFYYDSVENSRGALPFICPGRGPLEQNTSQIMCESFKNIAFVGDFRGYESTVTIPQVLQFSGNVAGFGLPLDNIVGDILQYKVYDYDINSSAPTGMTGSSVITLSSIGTPPLFNVVSLSFGGSTTIFPYNISTTSKSVATANGFYILSIKSCS